MSSGSDRDPRMTDPRELGGDIAGPGGPFDHGAVLLDASKAIHVDFQEVCKIDAEHGARGQLAFALLVEGRINQSQDRAKVRPPRAALPYRDGKRRGPQSGFDTAAEFVTGPPACSAQLPANSQHPQNLEFRCRMRRHAILVGRMPNRGARR
jgi:hypothetical protein